MEKVVIYTSDSCPHCKAAKIFLNDNEIEFEEKNVSENQAARKYLIDKGYTSVPVICVGSDEIMGFDPKWLREKLSI